MRAAEVRAAAVGLWDGGGSVRAGRASVGTTAELVLNVPGPHVENSSRGIVAGEDDSTPFGSLVDVPEFLDGLAFHEDSDGLSIDLSDVDEAFND